MVEMGEEKITFNRRVHEFKALIKGGLVFFCVVYNRCHYHYQRNPEI